MPAGENPTQEIHILEGFTEPFTFLLNDEEFTVELEPICHKIWEENNPDLPPIEEYYDNPTPANYHELTNLKELTYVGFDKTLTVYVMMQEAVTIRPDLIRAPSSAIGFYNSGIILQSGSSSIPVRRLAIAQTGPEQQDSIRRVRLARGLAQSPLQGIASGAPHVCIARVIIQAPASPSTKQSEDKLDKMFSKLEQVHQGQDDIKKGLVAVTDIHRALRTDHEELQCIHAAGYLKFAERVHANDFLALSYIMATGSRNSAASALNIPSRSFYDRVNRWKEMGPEYKRMFRMVEWRKKVGRKIKLRIEDSLLAGEPNNQAENPETIQNVLARIKEQAVDSRDYPDILRQILGAMSAQNPDNWQTINKEVIGILTEELP